MRISKPWEPNIVLERYFVPTNMTLSGERAKARIKNHNLPILQLMYNGSETTPLKCLISGSPGWIDLPCFVNNEPKQRFNIDFNHIRQQQLKTRCAGLSKDKTVSPSDLFRNKYLDKNILSLIEFITIIPVSQEIHNYISQDSALGNITLQSYDKQFWPWILQSEDNYNDFFERYNIKINTISYNWMIDHLSNINHDPIFTRIKVR